MKTLLAVACAVFLLSLFSCGTTKEGRWSEHEIALRGYESDFRPSDYDPDVRTLIKEERDTVTHPPGDRTNPPPTLSTETVQGFRVQVFSTSDFSNARAKQAEAELVFPDEWVYLVYEPPTYKVRIGNFLVRFEADRFVALAADRGFPYAWIVPEKVFKAPPPPPRPAPQTQGNTGNK